VKVFRSIDLFATENVVVTMGVFDGMHLGHIALLNRTVELAKSSQKESVVLTFSPHPRIVLKQDPEKLKLLTSLDEKTKIIGNLGIDNIIVLPFTAELATLNAEIFIEDILVNKLNISQLVVGYNHRFGNGGITLEKLNCLSGQFGFSVHQFPRIEIDKEYPSSSNIRNLLLEGKIREANKLLGYNYIIEGKVIDGKKMGRFLSYPTANILVNEPLKLIPPDGVYACFVKIREKIYRGMTNIGVCPTINSQNNDRTIEVHILNFNEDIYYENIELQFVARARDEIKFSNTYILKETINEDKIIINSILDKENSF
jgi:riboflavin kinase/FMN adenylyltransferase